MVMIRMVAIVAIMAIVAIVTIVAIVVNVTVVMVYCSENCLVMSLLREVWVRPKNDEVNLGTSKLPTTTNDTEAGG